MGQVALRSLSLRFYNQAKPIHSMNAISPFLSVHRPCDETLRWLKRRFSRSGLRLLQTFDLHDARLASTDCPCPHHGSTDCDCQMLVLLIYNETAAPATLVLHSNEGRTWISLVNTPSQHAEPSIRAAIEAALQVNLLKEGL